MNRKQLLIGIFLATATPSVFASNFYGLGSVGRSQIQLGQSTYDGQLANSGATNIGSTLDNGDTAWKLQAGYHLTPNFAIEGGYVDLGEVNYNAGYDQGAASGNYRASGWNIAGLGIMPLDDKFSLFGKLGVIDARVSSNLATTGLGGAATGSFTSTRWRPNYGFGGMYHLTRDTSMRVELERFDGLGDSTTTGNANVNLVSLGLSHNF